MSEWNQREKKVRRKEVLLRRAKEAAVTERTEEVFFLRRGVKQQDKCVRKGRIERDREKKRERE